MSSGHLYVLIIPDMKSLKHFLHHMARYVELELKKLDLWCCPEAGLLLAVQRWRESPHAGCWRVSST